VDLDVNKPLRRGVRVLLAGKPIWIQIKYLKLPDFCYGCGRLGHVLKGCDLVDEGSDVSSLQYGAWLRASPLKSRRRNAETELLEERRLFLAFKGTGGADAKKKLSFGATTASPQSQENTMAIDDQIVAVPEHSFLKRKLTVGGRTVGGDKFRIVDSQQDTVAHTSSAEAAAQPRLSQ